MRGSGKCALALALCGVWTAMLGCSTEPTPVGLAERFVAKNGTQTAATVTMPDAVWNVVQQRCVWCHTPQHPTGGFDFTQRSQTLATVQAIGTGVQQEMAPLVVRLPVSEKRTILDWVARTTGPLPAITIPPVYHWELNNVIAGLSDGAVLPGFGFVLEDGFIDSSPWKVATYTDRFGIRGRGVALNQTHSTSAAIFPQSRNPSSYFVFKGVPWHGRFHDMRLEGDVRVDRWISVGMQAGELQPTGRSKRDYVRLQFDRDAISLRSGPTATETWPWGGSAGTPGADTRLTGTLNASGFYQPSNEWLHFVLTATRLAGGVRWTALVTRRGTGATVASLQATERTTAPLGGMFFLHAYAVGGSRNWANLVFDAQVDTDASPPVPAPVPIPRPGGSGRNQQTPSNEIVRASSG